MANGQVFSASELLAASPNLPLGTMIKVTNLRNGLAVVVQIMDRGPFVKNRILDLSEAAARQIGCHSVCKVQYQVVRETNDKKSNKKKYR